MKAILNTDGGSRGNPGPSAIAFVVTDDQGNVVEKTGSYIGITTNNQAEYQALVAGMQDLIQRSIKEVIVRMDSELVVRQINGQYRVKNNDLFPWHTKIKELSKEFSDIKFEHVLRAENAEADAEVNRILDEQKR